MTRLGIAVSGKTLGRAQGFAGLSALGLGYKVQRAALTALAIGALVAGVSATSVALSGYADPGIDYGNADHTIAGVNHSGYAWQYGISPGDTVVSTTDSGEPGGWSMVTRDPVGNLHTVSAAEADASVAASLPAGVAGLILGGLAVLFLSTRRRWAVPTAALALFLASVPLGFNGVADTSTIVLGASALVPAISLGRRLPIALVARLSLAVALLVFIGAWAVARLAPNDASDELEGIRAGIAFWGILALLADRAVLPILRGEAIGVMRPRLFDVGVIASFAVIGLVLMTALSVSPIVVGALLVAVMAVLPSTRRRIGEPLEDALFGDVREAAAAEAAEAERARLARDLHDVPLQELVAVIRRLEIMPGTEAESEDLRNLAGHLRNVATELRPPVLDDLGLPAALDYLAEESTSNTLPVSADIVDETGFGAERRPPADVELAIYRIASEAVGNAVRHSGGTRVRIGGSVAPGRVELTVADDGAGLAPDAAREAAKRKRMGLASMRRRAQAIDAELSIDGSTRGTQVRVAWQA
jgi:signal transduction histidine kinase